MKIVIYLVSVLVCMLGYLACTDNSGEILPGKPDAPLASDGGQTISDGVDDIVGDTVADGEDSAVDDAVADGEGGAVDDVLTDGEDAIDSGDIEDTK